MSVPGAGEHVVFVESNTTGTGRLAVERLLGAGAHVTFVTRSPAKYPFLAAPRPPRLAVEAVETNDLEAVTAAVGEAVRRRPAQVVLTFSEYYVVTVAEVAARLGFRFLSPAAARTCRDKAALRRALVAAGEPSPPFHRLTSESEARRVAERMDYPCVVKPPADSSSKGVRRVDDAAGLLAWYRELAGWRRNDREQEVDGAVLVEGLLDGPEYSVETMTLPGGEVRSVGITAKHLSPPPLYVEVGHDFPAAVPKPVAAGLERAAAGALAAVGFDLGPAHTEVRWTSAGPVVVEVNPRLAGGMIPELVQHALGIDLLDAYLDLLRGGRPDLAPRRAGVAAIRFLLAPAAGRLAAVEGVEAARRRPGVVEVTVTRAPGAPVRPAEHALDRLGHVIAAGDDRGRVVAAAETAAADVRFHVEPTAEPTLEEAAGVRAAG